MATRTTNHSTQREVEIYFNGDALTVMAHIDFTYHPGAPATPPCYHHGGLPPDPEEIEITKIALKSETGAELDAPEWLTDFVTKSIENDDCLSEIANDDNEPDPDEAYERARDDRDYFSRMDGE